MIRKDAEKRIIHGAGPVSIRSESEDRELRGKEYSFEVRMESVRGSARAKFKGQIVPDSRGGKRKRSSTSFGTYVWDD